MEKEIFNPENLFNLLKEKKWNEFLTLLYKNKKEISRNDVALQAKSLFIVEFIKELQNTNPILHQEVLELLILMNSEKDFILDETELHKIVTFNLEALKVTNEEKSVAFANKWKCFQNIADYLKDILEKQPFYISHTKFDTIQVTRNKDIKFNNYTISLFKSPNEYNFYCAVKECFPNYHTYPNVALSCIIDFNKIKDELNEKQKDYFLKAIVDCVVFNPDNLYEPKYFFELDSSYHDAKEIKLKDSWKDLFFSKAGVELFRIRQKDKKVSKEDYLELIKELFQ